MGKRDGYYIALGSFDGLHKGHLELINEAINLAKKDNSKSMVFTFLNHPREIINQDYKFHYLMENIEKKKILLDLGVDEIVLKEFDCSFMKISPEDFIGNLCKEYKVKGLVVGFNYRFGFKNKGDIHLLEELSKEYNFKLKVIEPFMYKEEVVSSTRIRNTLLEGNIQEANNMLNRPYSLSGIVVSGKQIGRTIGFPTANLELKGNFIIPKRGVYYTNVLYNNKLYKSITNIGNNPTVDGESLTIETFILDFDKTIYNEGLELLFLGRIRDEKKFNSLDDLKARLKKDKEFAEKAEIYYKK